MAKLKSYDNASASWRLRARARPESAEGAAERTRQEVFADVQKRNRVLAGETHLVREEDLRYRVLVAGVRIVNVGFGLL